jgi:hypothetical protein
MSRSVWRTLSTERGRGQGEGVAPAFEASRPVVPLRLFLSRPRPTLTPTLSLPKEGEGASLRSPGSFQ